MKTNSLHAQGLRHCLVGLVGLVGPVGLALGLVAVSASAHDIVWAYSDGSSARMTINSGLSGTQFVDCTGGLCNPCGTCHAGAQASSYDARQHQSSHFPRATHALAAGQTLRLADGVVVSNEGTQLCAQSERPAWRRCYPAIGTWLLKDKQGRPAMLWSQHAPSKR